MIPNERTPTVFHTLMPAGTAGLLDAALVAAQTLALLTLCAAPFLAAGARR